MFSRVVSNFRKKRKTTKNKPLSSFLSTELNGRRAKNVFSNNPISICESLSNTDCSLASTIDDKESGCDKKI